MAVDVSPVVTEITLQTVSVVLIGGACLALYVVIRAFRWMRLQVLGGSISVGALPELPATPLPDGPWSNENEFDYWNYSAEEVDHMIQRDLDALREYSAWKRAEGL